MFLKVEDQKSVLQDNQFLIAPEGNNHKQQKLKQVSSLLLVIKLPVETSSRVSYNPSKHLRIYKTKPFYHRIYLNKNVYKHGW